MLIEENFEEVSGTEEMEAQLEDELLERQGELVTVLEAIRNDIALVSTLAGVYDDYKNNRISEDRVKYAIYAAESALNTASSSPESISVIATEGLITRIGQGIVDIGNRIHVGFQKYADYVHFSNTLFTLQRGKLNEIEQNIAHFQAGRVSVDIGINKYMQYGEHESTVKDMKEYMEQYRLFNKTMVPFLQAVAGITEDDLFSGFKWYKEAIFGDPEGFVKDRFLSMEKYITHGAQGMGAHVAKQSVVFIEYRTPVLLGISSCFVRLPNKRSYNTSDYDSMYAAHKYFYMGVDRIAKVKMGTMFSGGTHLDVTKNDIKELCAMTAETLKAAEDLNRLSIKFSNIGAFIDGNNIFSKRNVRDEADVADIFESTRVYSRVCSLIYDSVSASYNLSFGNIKQALKICRKAIEKAK